MMRMASFGKSKRIETSKSMDATAGLSGRKIEKTRSDSLKKSPNFIARLTSMGSLKSSKKNSRSLKSSKSDVYVQAQQAPAPLAQTVIHNCEVSELEMAFKVFDANGDGQICISELGAVLRSLGGDVTEEELQLIMNDVDKNQDGFICLEEFKDVHNVVGEDPIREAFATFDKDGNNLICADELRTVLMSLGEKGHSLEDCRRMIRSVDQDGDGFVDFKEFQNLLSVKS